MYSIAFYRKRELKSKFRNENRNPEEAVGGQARRGNRGHHRERWVGRHAEGIGASTGSCGSAGTQIE